MTFNAPILKFPLLKTNYKNKIKKAPITDNGGYN